MRIAIVEDEPVIAQRLTRQVRHILAEHQPHICCVDSFDDAQSHILEQPIDLLFLDLNLYGQDGFELLKQATANSFHTIIVSAYAERAITAFEFGVLDFVAKPFSEQRLANAIERFLQQASQPNGQANKLTVKKPGGLQVVALDTVYSIQADGHYTQLILADGQSHLYDKPIERLSVLLPDHFIRVHRSYLVNLHCVDRLSIASGGHYHLQMNNGSEVPVSRSRYPQVRARIEQDR